MKRRISRNTLRPPAWALRLMCAAVLAALIPACGGGGSGPDPVPSTAPPPAPAPVTTVLGEGAFSGLAPDGAAGGTFTTPRAGDLEVIVDWTFASNDLDLLLFRGECSEEQFLADQCDLADVADSLTAKPERVGLAGAPAGAYTLVVINFGATEETFSYQILLTTVGSAAEGIARSNSRGKAVAWRPLRARLP
jgi:hypothetical protein